MKDQTGGTVWPSGNILELFLTAILATITVITNVCDDAQNIQKSTEKNGQQDVRLSSPSPLPSHVSRPSP